MAYPSYKSVIATLAVATAFNLGLAGWNLFFKDFSTLTVIVSVMHLATAIFSGFVMLKFIKNHPSYRRKAILSDLFDQLEELKELHDRGEGQ